MSTLEKTIDLLETMSDNKIETVYAFVQFVNSYDYNTLSGHASQKTETIQPMPGITYEHARNKGALSIVGIASQYAKPELIPLEKEAFANAMAEKHAID